MPKKSNKKANKQKKKMNKRSFFVNMIALKLYMPGWEFEPDGLKMKVNLCKGCKPIIDGSRINVNCMPFEGLCEFKQDPECVEKTLGEGVDVSVTYLGKKIGSGCYRLPASVIETVTTTTQEVTHTANCELTCKGLTVGTSTLRLTMQMRCPEENQEEDFGYSEGCNLDLRSYIESTVEPEDLIFVVGESSTFPSSSTDPCAGFNANLIESRKGSRLSKLRQLNKRTINNASVLEQCNYERPKLVDMAGPYNAYAVANKVIGAQEPEIRIVAEPGPSAQFAHRNAMGDGTVNRMCQHFSAPQLKQTDIKMPRRCPVCKEDVSWLPKLAGCPHCGYRPVPEFKERIYNEEKTANDILENEFNKPPSNVPSFGSVDGCPVKESVQDPDAKSSENFEQIVHDFNLLKQSIKNARQAESCATDPQVNKMDSGEQQPNMIDVFDELKNLLNLRSTKDPKTKIMDICNETCKMANATKSRRKKGGQDNAYEDPCKVSKKKKRRPTCRQQPMKSKVYSVISVRQAKERQRHIDCVDHMPNVPAHMGWLWTQFPLAQKPGWRPGAIRRPIRRLMEYFLKDFPVDTLPVSKYMSYMKQKPPATRVVEATRTELVQVPTLRIEKKNNEYIITLRPLKDATTLQRAANPYANMKPVQFRIVKSPMLKQLRELKRCLKNMGFSKCQCHRPVMQCYCRSFIDKKLLLHEVKRQCHIYRMPCCEDQLVLSDTTDSETEFDFGVTPPAGIMKPERLKVSDVAHAETQYDENDWAMPTMFPHPPNAYVQYGGCVTGERKSFFNWIYGKGNVHAEKPKPKMRNMPKKKKNAKRDGRQAGGLDIEPEGDFVRPEVSIEHYKQWEKEMMLDCDSKTRLSVPRMRRLAKAAYPPVSARIAGGRKIKFNNMPVFVPVKHSDK